MNEKINEVESPKRLDSTTLEVVNLIGSWEQQGIKPRDVAIVALTKLIKQCEGDAGVANDILNELLDELGESRDIMNSLKKEIASKKIVY